MKRYLLLGMFCLITSPLHCQEIDYRNTKARVTFEWSSFWLDGVGPGENAIVNIKAEINNDAVTLVKGIFERPKAGAINVSLDSPGGDVQSAIAIGRLVRANGANVLLSAGAQCASACLLILAGGAARYVDGKLGIHRPFLEAPSRRMMSRNPPSKFNNSFAVISGR
jgi:hypothetical protein